MRALLLFPLRPAESVEALQGARRRLQSALAPLVVAALVAAYLLARGCEAGDAAVSGLAALVLLLGMGLGGAAACYPAAFVTGATYRWASRVAPCVAFAAWTAVLFVASLVAVRAMGVGAEAALIAAILVLVWGVAAGTAVVGGEESEAGRLLVGSCAGLAGALAGLWLALFAVQALLLMVVQAPVATEQFDAGVPLLVRRAERAASGSVVLLRAPDSPEALLARIGPQGAPEPLGTLRPGVWRSRRWDIAGRAFFRFGGRLGGSVVSRRHPR